MTSQPQALRNCRARWPRPPMPTTPTLSVGRMPRSAMGAKTVMPPQKSGPELSGSSAAGSFTAHSQLARTLSAKPPWRPTIMLSACAQSCWRPERPGWQERQLPANQPRPTRSPTSRPFAWEPVFSMVPMTSWPGTSGYRDMPQELSIIERSEWHMPQDSTFTCTGSGRISPGSKSSSVSFPPRSFAAQP